MALKQRRFNMGLGIILESPDSLNFMETNISDRLQEADEMQCFNCEDAFPDDEILLEQEALFCLSPKGHSDNLDTLGVPLQERLTICVIDANDALESIEGKVVDRWLRKLCERVDLSRPVYTGPYPDPETVEYDDPIII